jgi:hypothetical protein
MASILNATTSSGLVTSADNSGSLQLATNNGTTAVTIDTSQNVGIGTASPAYKLDVKGTSGNVTSLQATNATGSTAFSNVVLRLASNASGADTTLNFTDATAFNSYIGMSSGALYFATNGTTERMRINSSGNVLVGTTSVQPADDNINGVTIRSGSPTSISSMGGQPLIINRGTNDGVLINLYQDAASEGNISVSGTTVSYNGGHLARWSQLLDNSKDDTILKGTVLTNLDDMCVWTKDGTVLDNEQLNKMKVSDVEGDTNVAGVFVNWTRDEQCDTDDMNVAMTGDMIIRIADGVVVQKGDLLMSAGDGTAKPQGDDIVRSKTIAKVTSNHITCTYADGSYCVPCVLMAC